jgi:hypothetical protein
MYQRKKQATGSVCVATLEQFSFCINEMKNNKK